MYDCASDPDILVPVRPSRRQRNASTSSYQKSCSSALAHHLRNLSADVGTNNMIASYDRFGCNWSIPVLESVYFVTNVWVRTIFLDRGQTPQMYAFATSPRRISNNNMLFLYFMVRDANLLVSLSV